MNRIYQGRVTNVQTLKPGVTKPKSPDDWQELDRDPKVARRLGEELLWNHHELFQDAVNYYTVCLLALASSEINPLTKIRQRIEATSGDPENEHHIWTKVSRKGVVRIGLRDSVAKYLMPENNLSTPQECFAEVLHENAAINLGLRAIAAPDCHEIHSRIRLENESGKYRPRRKSKREEARWKSVPKSVVFNFTRKPPADLTLRFSSGRGFWDTVNKLECQRCLAINAARLRSWGIDPLPVWKSQKPQERDFDPDDDIPM